MFGFVISSSVNCTYKMKTLNNLGLTWFAPHVCPLQNNTIYANVCNKINLITE